TEPPVFHSAGGVSATNVTAVTLTFAASGADLMRLSENADFSGAAWVSFVLSPVFYLSNAQGAHTIYMQLADAAGNVSVIRSHTVTLDSTPPDMPFISIVGGAYTKTPGITVQTLADAAAEIRIGQQSDLSDGA